MIPNHVSTYADLGFKTLPITYGKKASPPPEWPSTPSKELWEDAPRRYNTALQAGINNMFLLDPDTDHGAETVKNYLRMKGINAWRITTWRNFTHYWIKTVPPDGTQWNGKLQNNMGDWRSKNGYGLAAPSFVRMGSQHGFYRLPEDNPGSVPFVEWEDVLPLLQLSSNAPVDPTVLSLPLPTVRRGIPRWVNSVTRSINGMDETGEVSDGSKYWSSRSEAAMSVMMSGLLNGYSAREVMNWFDDYKNVTWWYKTASKAVSWISNEADRPVLQEMHKSVYDLPLKDEDVLKAMISILWYVGSIEGAVSNRDIQMLVARGRQSVSSSVSRLMKENYITLMEKSDGKRASLYQLNTNVERSKATESILTGIHPEVYRHGALSCAQRRIYDALVSDKTPKELADETQISTSGTYSALKKLQDVGLVTKNGRKWSREKLDKDQIHAQFSTSDMHLKRRIRIGEERGAYHRNRGIS